MPIRTLLAACLTVTLLVFAGPAAAQTPTVPQDGSGLSSTPPVDLDGGGSGDSGSSGDSGDAGSSGGGSAQGGTAAAPDDQALPRTGEDVGVLLLAGTALLLVGVGLRLRTADADLY